jgi:hypothetical protein
MLWHPHQTSSVHKEAKSVSLQPDLVCGQKADRGCPQVFLALCAWHPEALLHQMQGSSCVLKLPEKLDAHFICVPCYTCECRPRHQTAFCSLSTVAFRWDYEAGKMVHGDLLWNFAKKQLDHAPRLLMFQPGAMVSTNSRADMKKLVSDTLFLLLVMEELQRIPVWPITDCSSHWIAKSRHAKHGIDEVKVYAHGDSVSNRKCFDIGYMNNGCHALGVLIFCISMASSVH